MVRTLLLSWMVWILGSTQTWGQAGNICAPLIRRYEATHGIPSNLLTAISLVESGRKVGGSVVPWPWTINANGKPYVFASQKEAISMVRKLRLIGITSIDVGCMQVNLKQHPNAFPNLEAAFDPATNIAYAAKFLKAKKMNKGSWVSAVAHYHSSTARFHLPYKAKVLKTWAKVQNGRMTVYAPLDAEQSSVEMIYAEIKKHEGEFVKNVAVPSGRRLPVVVRFAPYKGFRGGIFGASRGRLPKIIYGKPKGRGKIIVNTLMMPHQKLFKIQKTNAPGKVIRFSGNTN